MVQEAGEEVAMAMATEVAVTVAPAVKQVVDGRKEAAAAVATAGARVAVTEAAAQEVGTVAKEVEVATAGMLGQSTQIFPERCTS